MFVEYGYMDLLIENIHSFQLIDSIKHLHTDCGIKSSKVIIYIYISMKLQTKILFQLILLLLIQFFCLKCMNNLYI